MEVRVKKRVKRAGRMEDMGELAIQFGSLDELNGLIERLRVRTCGRRHPLTTAQHAPSV